MALPTEQPTIRTGRRIDQLHGLPVCASRRSAPGSSRSSAARASPSGSRAPARRAAGHARHRPWCPAAAPRDAAPLGPRSSGPRTGCAASLVGADLLLFLPARDQPRPLVERGVDEMRDAADLGGEPARQAAASARSSGCQRAPKVSSGRRRETAITSQPFSSRSASRRHSRQGRSRRRSGPFWTARFGHTMAAWQGGPMEFGMFHEFQALPGETAAQSFANSLRPGRRRGRAGASTPCGWPSCTSRPSARCCRRR
jgi:hypothetical protein